MIRNPKLVAHAKVFARDRKDNSELLAMIEQYEVACGLSIGPVESRSKFWERKATERRIAICLATGFKD